jgi:integrase/recombinase XerD
LQAAACWRNRFLLVLLWFSGLQIGEALRLRRADLHLMPSAAALGCPVAGAHLHVVPRENANGACAKGGGERVVPLAHYVVAYYDLYLAERECCRPARDCDFVFVELFRRTDNSTVQATMSPPRGICARKSMPEARRSMVVVRSIAPRCSP